MRKFKKLLVPLDGSKNSIRALNNAISLAKDTDASITGMHIVRLPASTSAKVRTHYRKEAERIIQSASKIAKKSKINFSSVIKNNGYPGAEIVKLAKSQNFDMIVMGSRGPDPVAEMFLGSVANYVLNKSKVPVLLVK